MDIDDDGGDLVAFSETNVKLKDSYLEFGHYLHDVTLSFYSKVLDIFGASVCKKFLQSSTQEKKDDFIKRLKEAQMQKLFDRLEERLWVVINKTHMDNSFSQNFNQIMSKFKSIEELRQDNEIAKNHLQSVENEYTILERDTDKAIDKFEAICEEQAEFKDYID